MADALVRAFVKKGAGEMRAARGSYELGEYDSAAASAYYSALHMAVR